MSKSLIQYESDLFYDAYVIQTAGDKVYINTNAPTSLIGKKVQIYPRSAYERGEQDLNIPQGVIVEKDDINYIVQIINPDKLAINVGDHVKVMKKSFVRSDTITINRELEKEKKGDNVEQFNVTYLKLKQPIQFNRSFYQCTFLPIISNIEKSKTDEIRYEILEHLKNKDLCLLKMNDDLEDLLSKRFPTRERELNDYKTIQAISNKLGTGSLFRLKAYKKNIGILVVFEGILQDGKTVIYKKSKLLSNSDLDDLINIVQIWIRDYIKKLPYRGRIDEIVEEQLLISIGEKQDLENTQHFEIFRPSAVKIESLGDFHSTKWEMEKIGLGSFQSIKGNSAIGFVRFLEKGNKVNKGDWIVTKDDFVLAEDDSKFLKHHLEIEREVGRVHLAVEASELKGSDTSKTTTLYGAEAGIDYFLPYQFIALFSFKKIIGSGGGFGSSASFFEGALGYALAPPIKLLSFLDIFIGYKKLSYDLAELGEIGLGDLEISGPYAGVRFELPLYKRFTFGFFAKLFPSNTVKNSDPLLGEPKSSNSYSTTFTAKYRVNNEWSLFSSLTYDNQTISYQNSIEQNSTIFLGNIGVEFYLD